MIGFCFGGGMTWQLLAAGEPGSPRPRRSTDPRPPTPDFSGSKAAVLAVYGENDTSVNGRATPRSPRCRPRTSPTT